jgi:hypothetical protein
MRRLATVLGVVAVAVLVVACGGGGTTTVIEKTVSRIPPKSGAGSTPQATLKAYDLAWAEGNAETACELLVDSGRRAVETEMSNRTLGGLPLNCPERMEEVLQLTGPEATAQLERLAKEVPSDEVFERGNIAEVIVDPAVFMELKRIGESWYIKGSTIEELEPFVTKEEVEEYDSEVAEEEEAAERAAPGVNVKTAEELALRAIKYKSGEEVPYLTCPGAAAVIGKRFTCDASTESGKHYQAELEVVNEEGDMVVFRDFVSHEH